MTTFTGEDLSEYREMVTDLTTPEEIQEAGSEDLDRLLNKLETRAWCCYRVVPADCIMAQCGHERYTDDDGEDLYENMHCRKYEPRHDLMIHPDCPELTSKNLAQHRAREAWERYLA